MQRSILSPLLLSLAVALGCALAPSPAQARGGVVIYAPTAPPPLRIERRPPPRAGHVWIDGSWVWSHGRYQWRRGYWTQARRGHHYVAPHWKRDHRGWHRRDGYWHR